MRKKIEKEEERKENKRKKRKEGSTFPLCPICQFHSFFKIAFTLYMIYDAPENDPHLYMTVNPMLHY